MDELFKEANDKFTYFVNNLSNKLKKRLKTITKEYNLKTTISTLLEDCSIDTLLNYQKDILSLNNSLTSQLKIIDFFVKNNAKEAEQVTNAYEYVISELKKAITDLDEIKDTKEKLEADINLIINLQQDINFNYEAFLELIESSPLKEEEKLCIIAKTALDTTPKQEINKEENKEINLSKYYDIIASAQKLIDLYHNYLEENTFNYIELIKNYVQYNPELSTTDEKIVYYLTSLIKDKQDLEDELKNTDIDEDYLELAYTEIEKDINILLELINSKEKENTADVFPNIMFLLNENNQTYFDIPVDEYNKRFLIRLIATVEQKNDFGIPLKDNPLNQNIYVKTITGKQDESHSISYMQIANNKYLIIDYNSFDEIFNNTRDIVKTKEEDINNIMIAIKNSENPLSSDEQIKIKNLIAGNGIQR